MKRLTGKFLLTVSIVYFSMTQLIAQKINNNDASSIQQNLKKLNVLGSALYIAAHPDDENTRLITYFANEKLVNTAYLSLTRGDGGQNLIGPELNELLGVIRTQELLQARRTDGGTQYFSRAKDFGFSKNPDETFTIWEKEKVLADAVWVIRKFRPDVIVTRFNTVPGKTHGHHTASAIIAEEAFAAAADKNRFPEQLKFVDTWQAKRLLWNTSYWFYGSEKDFDTTGLLKIDVAGYNPLLGKSYTEIAAESRSMHKSQGFGTMGTRGTSLEYLEHKLGPKAPKEIFDGINTGWTRLEGGKKINDILQKAYIEYKPDQPIGIIDLLLEAKGLIDNLPDKHWQTIKSAEISELIKSCMGLYLESTVADYYTSAGQNIKVNVEMINRSSVPVEIRSVKYSLVEKDTTLSYSFKDNIPLTYSTQLSLPENTSYTQPYWLAEPGTKGMFVVNDQQKIGLPENLPAIEVQYNLTIKGKNITLFSPLIYKKADPVKGVIYRPFEITPPVFINILNGPFVFPDDKPKAISIKLKSGKNNVEGVLKLMLPEGWRSEPSEFKFSIKEKGRDQNFNFNVFPSAQEMSGEIKAIVTMNGNTFDKGLTEISYEHIPPQVLFPTASAKAVKINIRKKGNEIGYIMGAGDDVPQSLTQLGYHVTLLKEEQITPEKLIHFDAVIMGIRAYNTLEKVKYYQGHLLNYVKNGGTFIVQYNTNPGRLLSSGLKADSLGPYPFKISNDRVTVEEAPVKMLLPNHEILNRPNKISSKDFDNWIQERGLYFPNEWSKEYQAILSTNDPGESPKDGGLLVAKYGKGYYIYTSYSWFRELPAAVPGAYKLFTNMISIGK